MRKINWIVLIVFILLIYTRFVNLGWGLPYPMHPDERNMANAVQSLHCSITNYGLRITDCLNPHFFAYGQFPLYLAYLLIIIYKGVLGRLGELISFSEAVMALRFISALASVVNVFVIWKIVKNIRNSSTPLGMTTMVLLIFIFSPALIQLAHFGTTESLLMLFYSLIIYQTLYLLHDRGEDNNILKLGLWSGLAIATKVSAGIFVLLPLIVIITNLARSSHNWYAWKLIVITTVFGILFSPYNLISFNEFVASIRYESAVASGNILVFYTRQFVDTVPIVFQFVKIFPYALGWPVLILFVAGFLFLPWKKETNILRLAFIIYFIPNAFLFAKWTRFMSPVFPIMLVIAALFIKFSIFKHIITGAILIISVLPGIAYLSVYQNPDVRLTATQWIDNNIPKNSLILAETANVVDVPFDLKNYRYISFNFYDLDKSYPLQNELQQYIKMADYIIVPSRRVFMNHQQKTYPILNNYYQRLFSGSLSFNKMLEITSYPRFNFQLEFPDEQAEETWSVFDHPVIRIYKNNNL